MVRGVLSAVYREVKGLHEAAYVLALFTVGSQVLALVRDRLLAHEFGAGIELDLFYAAFRVPDLLYVLFASMLSVYVLIPFVAERIKGEDSTRAREFLSQIFSVFLIVYVILAGVAAIFAEEIVQTIFPGFSEHTETLVLLMRILLIQPFFLGISSLLGVITQYQSRFVLYAISPLLYNLGIIFGLLVFYPRYGLSGLVLGVVLGALGHFAIQIPYVLRNKLRPRLTFSINTEELKGVLRVSIPRTLTLSLHQLVLLGMVAFASIMTVGSVSVFQFAFNLQSVPLAIIGVSYSIAAFPLLARLHAEGKTKSFGTHLETALRHILFWSLPVAALMIVVRAQFVRVVFGTGAFDWDDTKLTAAILAVFVISLFAQAINLLIVRALYAEGNTRLPFMVTLISSVGALVLSYGAYVLITTDEVVRQALEYVMRLEGVAGTEVLALPIGYSLALLLHSSVLLYLARRELSISLRRLFPHGFKALLAAIAGGVVAYGALNILVMGLRTETLIGILLQGALATLSGAVGAAVVYYFLKSEELYEVYWSLHRRVLKPKTVVPPQDEDHLAV